jgi:hypothetical protein
VTWRGRGHGFREDRPAHHKRRFRALRGGVSTAPERVDLSHYEAGVFDQGPTNSCTAHAKIAATIVSARAQGHELPFMPSPCDLYRIALCLDRKIRGDGIFPRLEDEGAEPGKIEEAIRSWGLTPMRERPADGRLSDCTPENVTEEPDFGLLVRAAHTLVTGDYAIDTIGDELQLEVQIALSLGHAVNVGFWADPAFDACVSSTPPLEAQDRSAKGGWHYATLVGYDLDRFRLLNSWGLEWGELGHCWVGPAWLRQCVGIYACSVTEVGT